jgi:hypothetical protein
LSPCYFRESLHLEIENNAAYQCIKRIVYWIESHARFLYKQPLKLLSSSRKTYALAAHHSNMKAFPSILSIDFALLATLGLLSLAGSNRAADTDSQRGALKSGARLWAENCILCHEIKPRVSFTSAKLDSITRHMRQEDLSPEEQEAILGFLKSGN